MGRDGEAGMPHTICWTEPLGGKTEGLALEAFDLTYGYCVSGLSKQK